MASLTAHLRRAGRPRASGLSSGVPDLPPRTAGRRACRPTRSSVAATQACSPPACSRSRRRRPPRCSRAEPDQEQEGARRPSRSPAATPPASPDFDPGGESTDLPFDAAAGAEPTRAARSDGRRGAARAGAGNRRRRARRRRGRRAPRGPHRRSSTADAPATACARRRRRPEQPAPRPESGADRRDAPPAATARRTPPRTTRQLRRRAPQAERTRSARAKRREPRRAHQRRARAGADAPLTTAARARPTPTACQASARPTPSAASRLGDRDRGRAARRPLPRRAAGRVAVVDRQGPARRRRVRRPDRARGQPAVGAQQQPHRHRRPRPADGRHEARAAMSGAPAAALERRDVHPGAAGRRPPGAERRRPGGCAGSCSGCSSPRREREEAELERRIRTQPGVTRPNTIALISPKGGVGKTTSTFLAGNLLATHLKLRAIAVDANPDFGTLARLAPDERRSERSLADLLDDAERLNTAAELGAYVSRLPTGLHVLGAPRDAELTASLGPDRYGELVAFLAMLLRGRAARPRHRRRRSARPLRDRARRPGRARHDAGVGDLDRRARGARRTCSTTAPPSRSTSRCSLGGRRARSRSASAREHLHRAVTIPYDEQLATMLDSGTYALEALGRRTRLAIKRLGLAVAEQLV